MSVSNYSAKSVMKRIEPDQMSATNRAILKSRAAAILARPGPAVGDVIRLPRYDKRQAEFTRITHRWANGQLQTGGSVCGAQFYLGDGFADYSGGLDPGMSESDLVATGDTKECGAWFFSENEVCAGNGLAVTVPFKVYDVKEGADLSGVREFFPRWVIHRQDHGGFRVMELSPGYCHYTFFDDEELMTWLKERHLSLPESDAASNVIRPVYAPNPPPQFRL
jgi:hypothetical protein